MTAGQDTFEFHVGWRQFDGAPIYSHHNPNADKHKFERFFPHGKHLVASLFAPVCFKPATVLMFKRDEAVRCQRSRPPPPPTAVAEHSVTVW